MSHPQPPPSALAERPSTLERSLPSGRSFVMRLDDAGEQLEIRSPGGELEVSIVLGPDGPVVRLRGARLEVDSPEIALRCRTFDVQATSALNLQSQGDLRLKGDEIRALATRDIHLNGAFIRLNCDDNAAPPAPELPAPSAG